MKNIRLIAKKEFWGFLTNPLGFVFAALLIFLTNWLFLNDLFLLGQASMTNFWTTMIFMFSLFVPAISMNLIAEEKRRGTWEILLSLPVTETEMVVGKFLGAAGFLTAVVGLSLPTMFSLMAIGKPDIGLMISGMAATLVLGWAYLAIALLASTISNQAVIGFIGATVFLLLNNMMGQETLLNRIPTVLRQPVAMLSLNWRTGRLLSGLWQLTDVVFLISWMVVSLTVAVLLIRARSR